MPIRIHDSELVRGPIAADPGASSTVLVVDDSVFDHHVIDRLLRPVEQLRVIYATGGREALEIVERDSPDLILTDLIMPDMDGLELVQQARGRFPSIPMILMTAFGSEEAAMRALRAGAANYIPKKDLARDLVETVQQILRVAATDRHRRDLLRCLEHRESLFYLSNNPRQIAYLIQLVQEDLDGLGVLDRTGQIRVGVALQEALTNALYHGNLELSSDLRQEDEQVFYVTAEERRELPPYASRQIRVLVRIDRRAATFEIGDDGPGFDTSRIDRPIEPEDLSRIGGRGILLIRTFMDEVAFNTPGNAITMVKRFPPGEPPGAGC
jgi:CheY-like chemotaxis protein/anti-sigma regulatory factor (Ser/Thr protein kinase)